MHRQSAVTRPNAMATSPSSRIMTPGLVQSDSSSCDLHRDIIIGKAEIP
jgi:hypothetical protein